MGVAPVQVHDGSYTPTEQFRRDPDSLCSQVTWRDEEDRVIWIYKIQVRIWCGGLMRERLRGRRAGRTCARGFADSRRRAGRVRAPQ